MFCVKSEKSFRLFGEKRKHFLCFGEKWKEKAESENKVLAIYTQKYILISDFHENTEIENWKVKSEKSFRDFGEKWKVFLAKSEKCFRVFGEKRIPWSAASRKHVPRPFVHD